MEKNGRKNFLSFFSHHFDGKKRVFFEKMGWRKNGEKLEKNFFSRFSLEQFSIFSLLFLQFFSNFSLRFFRRILETGLVEFRADDSSC